MEDLESRFSGDQLRRSSRRAANISLVGFMIVFIGLGWGIIQVHSLSAEGESLKSKNHNLSMLIDKNEKDLADRNQELANRKNELAVVKQNLKSSREELEITTTTLELYKKELQASENQIGVLRIQKQQLTSSLQEDDSLKPLVAKIKPMASIRKLTGAEAEKYKDEDRKVYGYSLWIEAPKETMDRISKVTYIMNKPTFYRNRIEGKNSQDNFTGSYNGYDPLTNVIVEVTMKNGTKVQLDFNQAEAVRAELQKLSLESQ